MLTIQSGGRRSRLHPVTTNTSLSRTFSCKEIVSCVKVLAADSVTENETVIGELVVFNPLGMKCANQTRCINYTGEFHLISTFFKAGRCRR